MKTYTASRVLSVRIEDALLEAVRRRANDEGRSVSGQIVYFVREQLEREEEAPKQPQKISGWLSRRAVPSTHEEFRLGRAAASQKLRAAIRRKTRRK